MISDLIQFTIHKSQFTITYRRHVLLFYYILFGIVIQIIENPFVKNNSQHNADCNAGISEVEDGGEEVGTAPKREFVWDGEELEVEHIDHLAEEEGRVAVPGRPLRHLQIVAFGEKEAVKHAVDNVTECTGNHQTKDGQYNSVHLVALQPVNEIPAKCANEENTDNGKDQFSDLLSETDTESHPFVLDKVNVKPLSYQGKCLPYSQMSFYPEFDNLINYDEQKHHNCSNPSIFLFQFDFFNKLDNNIYKSAKIQKYQKNSCVPKYFIFLHFVLKKCSMKKKKFFLPIMIILLGVFFFSQCKKDTDCTLRLTCNYSPNNTLIPAENAFITFETNLYDTTHPKKIDSLILSVNFFENGTIKNVDDIPDSVLFKELSKSYQHTTNPNGVFTYILPYPALLLVKATKVDTIHDQTGNIVYKRYTRSTQVMLKEGETSDVKIELLDMQN